MKKRKRGDNKQVILMEDRQLSKDIFNIRHTIYNRLQFSHNLMLEEFLTSMELTKKVEIFESLITLFLRRQQEILEKLWTIKGKNFLEYDIDYLQMEVENE